MSAHTPGPWNVAVEDGDTYLYAPGINGLSTRETLMCDMPYYPWINFTEADWNLVAAAPDLLEALKDTAEALEHLQNSLAVKVNPPTLEKARAAIAKAEGEQA